MRCSQIVKFFTLAVLIAFSGIMLTGCGEKAAPNKKADPNIELAKNTVFPADKSRTLGEAASANFNDVSWETYKNNKNQQIVEFTGTWKHGSITNKYYNYTQRLVNSGNKVTARFIVNRDQSVEFVSATVRSDKNDLGTSKDYAHPDDQYGDDLSNVSNGIEVKGGDLFVNKVILHK